MIGVTLELSVEVSKTEAFLQTMNEIIPETRGYDGCHKFDLWVDQGTPGRILMNEIWESEDHHKNYLGWRTETGVMETLMGFMQSPPVASYYTIIDI